jgi:hypothetical protein
VRAPVATPIYDWSSNGWAGHWAGKSQNSPECLPEKYGRLCVLPGKSRHFAGFGLFVKGGPCLDYFQVGLSFFCSPPPLCVNYGFDRWYANAAGATLST